LPASNASFFFSDYPKGTIMDYLIVAVYQDGDRDTISCATRTDVENHCVAILRKAMENNEGVVLDVKPQF